MGRAFIGIPVFDLRKVRCVHAARLPPSPLMCSLPILRHGHAKKGGGRKPYAGKNAWN